MTDLNDFITPSQVCIKPVEQVKPEDDGRVPGGASVSTSPNCFPSRLLTLCDKSVQTEIQIDSSGSYYEISGNGLPQSKTNGTGAKKLEQAQISLNDCLACRYVPLPTLPYAPH